MYSAPRRRCGRELHGRAFTLPLRPQGACGGRRLESSGRRVAPSLGLLWSHCVTTRLFVSRCALSAAEHAAAAPAGYHDEGGAPLASRYSGRKMEVVFAPHLAAKKGGAQRYRVALDGVWGVPDDAAGPSTETHWGGDFTGRNGSSGGWEKHESSRAGGAGHTGGGGQWTPANTASADRWDSGLGTSTSGARAQEWGGSARGELSGGSTAIQPPQQYLPRDGMRHAGARAGAGAAMTSSWWVAEEDGLRKRLDDPQRIWGGSNGSEQQ